MSTFQVKTARGLVLLETDDWVDAQDAAIRCHQRAEDVTVSGTHLTHDWGPPQEGQGTRDRRCTRCGGWDNGSYGSQAPCGYDWGRASLLAAVERELQARKESA